MGAHGRDGAEEERHRPSLVVADKGGPIGNGLPLTRLMAVGSGNPMTWEACDEP
jgi:hypothetical protein